MNRFIIQLKQKKYCNKKLVLLLLLTALFCHKPLLTDTIGSDTAVSVQGSHTFSGTDNLIEGFIWLQNGFILSDSNTTCTFHGFFPVEGTIQLNGGSLTLSSDLFFAANGAIAGPGTIDLGIHTLKLPSSDLIMTSSLIIIGNGGTIDVNGRFSLSSTWTFQGHSSMVAKDHILSLGSTGLIYIDSDAQVTFKNMLFSEDIDTANLVLADSSSTFILDDVQWIFASDYVLTPGASYYIVNHSLSMDTMPLIQVTS